MRHTTFIRVLSLDPTPNFGIIPDVAVRVTACANVAPDLPRRRAPCQRRRAGSAPAPLRLQLRAPLQPAEAELSARSRARQGGHGHMTAPWTRLPPPHVVSGHHVLGVDGKGSGRAWRSGFGKHELPDFLFCVLILYPDPQKCVNDFSRISDRVVQAFRWLKFLHGNVVSVFARGEGRGDPTVPEATLPPLGVDVEGLNFRSVGHPSCGGK